MNRQHATYISVDDAVQFKIRPAQTMSHLNSIFIALLKEARFTKELLGAGATEIRRANYATMGVYFQSFTSLSTGLERIGKLCLMLDYYIETSGRFPDFRYLKNEIGHNLTLLQRKAVEVTIRRNINVELPLTPIHQAISTYLANSREETDTAISTC